MGRGGSAVRFDRHLADLADDLADVVFDALDEGGKLRGTALDAVQVGLPLPGHDGALHFRMHDLDEADALVRGLQALAVAHDVFALQQHFDDGRAGGRSAEAGLFHGVGELFFVERFARGFHGREERALGETFRRAGLLFEDFGIQHVLRLAFGEAGGQLLFGGIGRSAGSLFRLGGGEVQHLPAELLHGAAGGVIAIHEGVVANRRDHRGHGPDVVFVPGAQQAAADEVVDFALVGWERSWRAWVAVGMMAW